MNALERERQRPARARAGQIREGIANYLSTLGVIAIAYQEQDHLTLGYESWQEYVDTEFSAERLRLPAEHRQKAVAELRLAGLSTRAIGTAIGVSRETVRRDLAGDTNVSPEEITGADGKTYSAKAPVVEAMAQAIEDAAERAQDQPDPTTPAEVEPVLRSGSAPGGEDVGRLPASSPPAPSTAGAARLPADPGPQEAVARAMEAHLPPDPDEPHRAWRREFFGSLVAARAVMRPMPDEVARRADPEALDELYRVARDLRVYADNVAGQIKQLYPNVTPLRSAR